jgi:hypothetical protein
LRHKIAPGWTGIVEEVKPDLIGDVRKPTGRRGFLGDVGPGSSATREPANKDQEKTKTRSEPENAGKHEIPGHFQIDPPFRGG